MDERRALTLMEETEQNPINPYAESKVAAEQLLSDATTEYDFTGTALRMSTNYGWSPGIRFNLVVNHFVFRGLTNRPLTVYGDGSNWRPFIGLRDTRSWDKLKESQTVIAIRSLLEPPAPPESHSDETTIVADANKYTSRDNKKSVIMLNI